MNNVQKNEILSRCDNLPDYERKNLIRLIRRQSDASLSSEMVHKLFEGFINLDKDAQAEIFKTLVETDLESDRQLARIKRKSKLHESSND